MPVVFIPGKGNVQFPDSMTPYQIQLAIEREILPGKKPETISAPKAPEATIGSFLRGAGENLKLGLQNVREAAQKITPGELIESGLTTAGQILTAPQVLQNRLFEAAGLREKAPPPPPPPGPRVSQIIDQALGLGSPEERARRAAEQARRAAAYGPVATRTAGEQRRLSQQTTAELAKPEFESVLGEGLYSGVSSLAQMAPGVAASLLTRSAAPALASAGLLSATDQYFNVLDRGGTKEEALQAAQLTGATEVATEVLPMGVVLNNLGKVGVGKFLRDYLGKDLPTELVATITQNAIDTAIANPDKTWAEYFNELPRDLGVTAISTLVPGAGLATAGKGLEIASRLAERGAPEDEIAAALQGASTEAAAPRTAPRPPSPPADMGALSQALGPVGGKITLQEPSGPQEYTYQGLDEDGSVLLADADGQIFAEDPDQIAAAMQVGAAEPEEGLGGMAFGMDVTEGLPPVEAPVAAEPAPEPAVEVAPAPEESIAPSEPKIFPVDKEVASYMDEYSRFRSADQMNQIMAMATDLAREKGKRSISRDELFNAAMQFDDQMAARGRPAPKQPPAPAQPAQMSPEDAKELADEQDFLERLEDDLAYISETRAENVYEGEDPETKAAYEQDIAELEASRQERLRNIEAIKAKYAAPAAPAAPTGLQDLGPELERIMGKFHPQLREMFILPKIQEKIASGERFTVKDIPDALRKNIPQADRLIVARALAENPQQLVDVANAVPFTTPVGDVVYPTAAQPQAEVVASPAAPAAAPAGAPVALKPYEDVAMSIVYYPSGAEYSYIGAKEPEWGPPARDRDRSLERYSPGYDYDTARAFVGKRDIDAVEVKNSILPNGEKVTTVSVIVPSVDETLGDRGNHTGVTFWFRGAYPADLASTIETAQTVAKWIANPSNSKKSNGPLNRIGNQALEYVADLGGREPSESTDYNPHLLSSPNTVVAPDIAAAAADIQNRLDAGETHIQVVLDARKSAAPTAPKKEAAPPAPPAAVGKTAKARVPSTMQKVDVQYELQDLGNIRFAEGDLQNRDRSRPQTQQFLRDFTSTFDPEALGEDNATDRGAPIINKDNTILSGNGRTMGLEEIYDNYPEQAEAYRNFLREQGYNIEGIERPVLVRRLLSDVDERQFVVGSNVADIAALSPPELARQDAQDILTPEILATYYGGDLKAAKNDAFVGRFIAKLSAKERGDAMDAKGNPSAQVLQRIRNALLYKAYGESGKASEIFISKAMERADDDTKTLTNALIEAANDWIKFQREIAAGNIDPKYDITDKLMEAVAAVSDIKERGLKVRDYLRSEDLVEPLDPFVKDILLAFHNDNVSRFVGKNVISGMLSNYAETAADQQAAPDMLGMAETPSAGEIWRRIDRETDKSPKSAKDQGQMFQPSERSYIKVENNAQVMEVLDTGTPEQMKNAIAQAQKPDDKSNQIGADAQKKNRGCD